MLFLFSSEYSKQKRNEPLSKSDTKTNQNCFEMKSGVFENKKLFRLILLMSTQVHKKLSSAFDIAAFEHLSNQLIVKAWCVLSVGLLGLLTDCKLTIPTN